MKKVMLALGAAILMGATWFAAGHYYSNNNHVEEVSYKFAQFELDENPFLTQLSTPKQTSIMDEAKGYIKAALNPIRTYISGEEEANFNGAKIFKVSSCSSASNSSNTGSSVYVAPSANTDGSTFSFNDYDVVEPSYLETQPTNQYSSGGGFLFNRSIQH